MHINDLDQLLGSLQHPLGNLNTARGRALQQTSMAIQEGAINLLTKARHAILDGNVERADTFLTRAVTLPFDNFEESTPAGIAATMMLFNLITDEAETSESGEHAWLDAATDVLVETTGTGTADLQRTLATIGADYQLEPREQRVIKHAVADMPDLAELRDIADDDHAELAARVHAVLLVCNAYETALATRRAARRLVALGGSDAAATVPPPRRTP